MKARESLWAAVLFNQHCNDHRRPLFFCQGNGDHSFVLVDSSY